MEPKLTGNNGKSHKVIKGRDIAGEWERKICTTGMIIKEGEYKAQLCMDNLSYTSAYSTSDSSGRSHVQHFAGGRTTSSKHTRHASSTAFKNVIACDLHPPIQYQSMTLEHSKAPLTMLSNP